MFQNEGLGEQWGFSAKVECNNRVILFDTGSKGNILDGLNVGISKKAIKQFPNTAPELVAGWTNVPNLNKLYLRGKYKLKNVSADIVIQ